jgi:BMFP domain-containing protein YqiC
MNNPMFDEFAKMAGGAMGMAGNVKNDMMQMFQTHLEGLCEQFGLVRRAEFDAVLERLAALEAQISKTEE